MSEHVWQDLALCAQVDYDIFYVDKGASVKPAKLVCSGCTVRDSCLQYSLDNDEHFGIWGGMTANERRPLLRERHRQAGEVAA